MWRNRWIDKINKYDFDTVNCRVHMAAVKGKLSEMYVFDSGSDQL